MKPYDDLSLYGAAGYSEERTPNPGSDRALELGCICSALDNGRGNEMIGQTRGFYITQECPIHDKSEESND